MRVFQWQCTPALSPSDAERENAKLTAAINRAKDSGDIVMLRKIAKDPHGFIWCPASKRVRIRYVQTRWLVLRRICFN